jgi:hypothetical protein
LGGEDVGKAPSGPQRLLEVELTLTTLQFLLLADGLPDASLVETHCADAVARRPEVQPAHPTLVEQLPVDPNRTLPFRKPIAKATLYLGGMLKHRWTWSGIACPSSKVSMFVGLGDTLDGASWSTGRPARCK